MRRFSLWLKVLPAGSYSLGQLAAMTGKSKQSLCRTFRRLRIASRYKVPKNGNRGQFPEVTYLWKGYESVRKRHFLLPKKTE